MPNVRNVYKYKSIQKIVEVGEGDVIRFGRIPFKIAKLVLEPEDPQKANTSVNQSASYDYNNVAPNIRVNN